MPEIIIPAEYTERVAAGAAVLDEVRPVWRGSIETEHLDIDSVWDCVLSQLWGRYGIGRDVLDEAGHDTCARDWTFDHGFDPCGSSSHLLTEAWKAEVSR